MPVKRLHYFHYQFLQENDFTDEQDYHLSMRRRHNQDFHTWGRVQGLDVSFSPGERKVTISPGMAVDSLGREIIIESNHEVDLRSLAGKSVYLVLEYKEEETGPTTQAGVAGNTRITQSFQTPKVYSAASPPAWDTSRELILAKVTINPGPPANDGAVTAVDMSERSEAGAKIGQAAFPGLKFTVPSHGSPEWPGVKGVEISTPGSGLQGIEVQSPKTSFSGSLEIKGGDLLIKAAAEDPGDIIFQNASGVQKGRIWSEPAAGAGLHFSSGDNTPDVTINATGNVGIGTTNPTANLEIAGTVKISNSLAVGSAASASGTDSIALGIQSQASGLRAIAIGDNARASAQESIAIGSDITVSGTGSLGIRLGGGGSGVAVPTAGVMAILEGNVGIGTTAPDHKFAVSDGSNATQAIFGQDRTSGNSRIVIGEQDAAGKSVNIDYNHASKYGSIQIGGDALGSALVIAAGGNVGIGTTTPGARLEIKGGDLLIKAAAEDPGDIIFQTASGTQKGRIWTNPTVNVTGLHFSSGDNTPDVTIDASGNVGVGTSSPVYRLDVKSKGIKLGLEENGGGQLIIANNPNDNRIYLEAFSATGNASATELLLTGKDSQPVPQISLIATTTVVSGNALKPGGGAWGSTSDKRLKKNIAPLTGVLDKLLQLRGVTYEWKKPEHHGDLTGPQMGLVAQEVEAVFPEWVGTHSDGNKTLTIRGFEALTVEALRELNRKIDELEKRNEQFLKKFEAQTKVSKK